MNHRTHLWLAVVALAATVPAFGGVDTGVIRLGPRNDAPTESVQIEEPRRAFDFDAFQSRLESLWFQRKTFLANGRSDEAEQQLKEIRAFAAQEGIHRLDALAGALLAEARRNIEESSYRQAVTVLDHAVAFDPDRPEVYRARAKARWKARESPFGTLADLGRAFVSAFRFSVVDMRLFHQLLFAAVLAVVGTLVVFSAMALVRHNKPFRHEIEEWIGQHAERPWPRLVGWAAVLLPLMSWVGAAWAPVYWIVISFRFMRRAERAVAVGLLVLTALLVPANRIAVALYGTSADPAVRTTLASADGSYDPDRIVELRSLVQAHPDDAVYRFLLAGLYKNGRYLQEAFTEYKKALELDPNLIQAHTNIGNIFFTTGQYPEAIANYRRTLEIEPDSFLAWFNLHMAQSEAFRFDAAKTSLERARSLDAGRVARLLSRKPDTGETPTVQNERLETSSVWEAALAGRRLLRSEQGAAEGPRLASAGGMVRPAVLLPVIALLACGAGYLTAGRRAPARSCIRCGRPFCHYCKSGREAREYCSQCVHLYVLGDGLAPANKTRKLYEVERHEKRSRRTRSLLSATLPGTSQILRGRAAAGTLLVFLWLACLIAWRPRLIVAAAALVGFDLPPESLELPSVPDAFAVHPLKAMALPAVPVVWVAANAWRWKRREG